MTSAIVEDHRELEEYYNEVINHPNDRDHQQRFGNQFVWELARHSVGEELVLYPAMEKHLGSEGHNLAENDRKEHHSVGQLWKQ
jgi:hemerythrin superfamily protein